MTDCPDIWHTTLSVRHETCPSCGGSLKRDAAESAIGRIAEGLFDDDGWDDGDSDDDDDD
jgi:hypothetical protein